MTVLLGAFMGSVTVSLILMNMKLDRIARALERLIEGRS